VANAGVILIGVFLIIGAIVGFTWDVGTGYTYPQINEVCISDIRVIS